MSSGIKIKNIVVGTGLLAKAKSQVVVDIRGTLKRGDVFVDTRQENVSSRIELGRRDCIPGLRYGIIGMRVGGRRELVVSPHLGYGAKGLPGKVPPDAVLRFEVELLEVREPGISKPEDYPPGRHLYFFWPGEMKRNQPRIQFGMEESGRCGVFMTIPPKSNFTWRHAKTRSVQHQLRPGEADAFFGEIAAFPDKYPRACLSNESLWADSSEKGNSVTRDSKTNTPCITMGISERGVWLNYYSMHEDAPVLQQSQIFNLVRRLVQEGLRTELNP